MESLLKIAFGLVFICSSQILQADTVLLEDHFGHKNEKIWEWGTLGQSTYEVSQGLLSLFVKAGANDQSYSDAEVVSLQGFLQKNLEVVASNDSLAFGSRGWGYWNQSLDPKKSEVAFFIYLHGDAKYPLNGFLLMTQQQGKTPEFYPLDEKLLLSTHTYSITWSGDSISYGIDGSEVHKVSGNIPLGAMNIHLWSDNSVYDPQTFAFIFQKVSSKDPMNIYSVKVSGP